MKRLTKRLQSGAADYAVNMATLTHPQRSAYRQKCVDRLTAYDDICFDADGKERITVEELSALVKAQDEGLLVVLEGITTGQANTIMGMCEQLNAMKARHGDDQEPLITWQLYNALTKSFARAEAEAAQREEGQDG